MIHKLITACGGAAVALVASVSATAAPVTFSTQPGSSDFPTVTAAGNTGATSLTSVPNDGLTLTVTAAGGLSTPRIAGSTDGEDGFGVAGNSSYDINGSDESLTLTLNQDVYIDQITFDVFGFTDQVSIEIPSLSILTDVNGDTTFDPAVSGMSTGGAASGPFAVNFASEQFLLLAGQTIVIKQGSGSNNGILLDGITVTPVPEPGSMALLACGVVAFVCRHRTASGSEH